MELPCNNLRLWSTHWRAGKHDAKAACRPALNQTRCSPELCASWTWLFGLAVPLGISAHLLCYVDLPNQLSASLGISVSCSLNLNVPLKTKLICLASRGENASWLASIGLIKWEYWKTKTCQSVQWLCRQQYLGRHWQAAPSEHPIFCSVKSSRLFFACCDTYKSRDQQTVKKLFPRMQSVVRSCHWAQDSVERGSGVREAAISQPLWEADRQTYIDNYFVVGPFPLSCLCFEKIRLCFSKAACWWTPLCCLRQKNWNWVRTVR